MVRFAKIAVATGLLAMIAGPALADSCFEDVGCAGSHYIPKSQLRQLSCDALWTVRNTIYHNNGYCFRTQRALSLYSNDGCQYQNSGDVPLNQYERKNVANIRSVEQSKGCP